MTRYTVHYTGRVQGVGFRYTAAGVAGDLPVSGYVQNLPDGAVRLVAEGEKEDLDNLLAGVKRQMGRFIRTVTVERSAATGEFGVPGEDPLSIRR